jgi:GntR family transcriptional regulator/MocR family aminotransferase
VYLDLDNEGPRYAQLIRALKSAILGGRLVAGTRLPATRELAAELGVSRTTVVTAYEQLRTEGFIEGKVGSGSYVARLQREPQVPAAVATPARPSRYAQRLENVSLQWGGSRYTSLRYSLEYRRPLVNLALSSAWSRQLAHAARYTDPGYPHMQGLPALREAVCGYLARRRGVQALPDDVLIVNGTQQALSLIVRVFLDEGDTAVIEDPAYYAVHRLLVAHGAQVAAVRTDKEGLVCAELPAAARCVFVTPSHQFPGGSVLSLQRRLELLE